MAQADRWSWLADLFGPIASPLLPHPARVWAARKLINRAIKRYGQMTQLKIDNVSKTIDVELTLAGEKDPITIKVGQYDLTPAGQLTLSQISVSKEWMDLLAQDLVANKPFPIPADKAKWLRMVL